MIYLAYDGSINGDWVSRYAMRLAGNTPERALNLVHVLDGSMAAPHLEGKVELIETECAERGIAFTARFQRLDQDVPRSLAEVVPAGPGNLVVCGTRIRSRRLQYLTGTVSEKLLRQHRTHVLAMRVVQPGLLADPGRFLLPLSGHPRGFSSAWPIFRLFLPRAREVYLLRVMKLGSFRLQHLSEQRERSLRRQGAEYLKVVAAELARRCETPGFRLDTRVVISDDWANEVLVHASHFKTRLILLGASERSLPWRLAHGELLERILRGTPCDVGVYRAYE